MATKITSAGSGRRRSEIGFIGATLAVLLFTLLATACGGDEDQASATESPLDFHAADWVIPCPDPRAPVLFSSYQRQGRRGIYDEATPAFESYEAGNTSKDRGDYQAAATAYEEALRLEPGMAHAAYQLACNQALRGMADDAWTWFQKACELGFSDYAFCWDDRELATIRNRKGFAERMREIRRRSLEVAKTRTGTPVVFPSMVDGPDRSPIMMLLHGYGDHQEAYFGEARAWAAHGFLAVAVPASVPLQLGGYKWAETSLDVTHAQLQAILSSDLVKERGDLARVHLLGFSQGAGHALQLTAAHTDLYLGVVAIGIGGKPWLVERPELATEERVPSAVLVYGENEGTSNFTLAWSKRLQQAGWRRRVESHPGEHHFPENWEELRPALADFLLGRD